MSHQITIYDETLSGERTPSLSLDLMSSTITLRELIRRRVYEEVQDYNASTPEYFQGFVQPTDAERALNGYRVKERRRIDWETQYNRAIQSFLGNGFFVLIDDRQIEDLDTEIQLKLKTQVSFVKLVPLVGG
ncbi:hypothetical protein CCAX7_002760 [Capsulimonas corticalis]|uniref:Uncharacterized protein n=1 Tax=Capsulimonas corticalis TaxID=2219043 RepID=A0A402CS48_9BACT|nr:hypothetical protein [Capsulimonas corticalis]BDI28225.1 hypothetical protein CCAX7_002760 [Capsulimonas corticalis]